MDMIDILIAKSMIPEGQADSAAASARTSAATATAAKTAAEASATTAAGHATVAQTAATDAANAANTAAAKATTEIDKLALELTTGTGNNYIIHNIDVTYPSGKTAALNNVMKLYTEQGQNTDGGMTQKAITDALAAISTDITTLNTTVSNLSDAIDDINVNLGSENAGKVVIVGQDGTITASTVDIDNIVNPDVYPEDYYTGVEIDYINKTVTRLGYDPMNFAPWKDRQLVELLPEGSIHSIIGRSTPQSTSIGRANENSIMVYQPKFYYKRIPLETADNSYGGKTIKKEQLLISENQLTGYTIHPLFWDEETNSELDYVFIGAYEANADDLEYDEAFAAESKLQSMRGVKPISGEGKTFSIELAEQIAQNRGPEWHIMNMKAESAQQMLQLVYFESLNIQNASGAQGVVNIPNTANKNCTVQTGDAPFAGEAESSHVTVDGGNTITEYTEQGRLSYSFLGMENPWGNIWHMIGGAKIVGVGSRTYGGELMLDLDNSGTYIHTGILVPNKGDWISGFNYVAQYDWLFIPCEANGNSALPVGDNFWTTSGLNGTRMVMTGGVWSFGDACGPFCYAFDRAYDSASHSCGARIMFIPDPTKDYYLNNKNAMEGGFIV